MTEPDDRPAPPAAAPRRPAWQRAARVASYAAATVAVLAGACAAVVGTLWRSEDGTRWLLGHVPGLTVVDVHGKLGLPPNANVLTRVDAAGFWNLVLDALETLG